MFYLYLYPKLFPVGICKIHSHYFKQDSHGRHDAVVELGKSLGISISFSNPGVPVVGEMEDKEFLNLAYSLSEVKPSISGQITHIEVSW